MHVPGIAKRPGAGYRRLAAQVRHRRPAPPSPRACLTARRMLSATASADAAPTWSTLLSRALSP